MDAVLDSPPKSVSSEVISYPLSPEQIAMRQFFRGAFRYTQGSLAGQSWVNLWTVSSGRLPNVDIPKEPPDYIQNIFPPKAHSNKDLDVIERERTQAWEDLHLTIKDAEGANPDEAAGFVLSDMLEQELKYQLLGRRGRKDGDDQYYSYMRKYLVLGESSDSPILDQLSIELRGLLDDLRSPGLPEVVADVNQNPELSELAKSLKSYKKGDDTLASEMMDRFGNRKILAYIVGLWETHHRGELFFPETSQATA